MCQIILLGALGIQPRTTKMSHATGICYGKMGAKITLKEQGKLPERAGIVVLPLMTSNSTSREHQRIWRKTKNAFSPGQMPHQLLGPKAAGLEPRGLERRD